MDVKTTSLCRLFFLLEFLSALRKYEKSIVDDQLQKETEIIMDSVAGPCFCCNMLSGTACEQSASQEIQDVSPCEHFSSETLLGYDAQRGQTDDDPTVLQLPYILEFKSHSKANVRAAPPAENSKCNVVNCRCGFPKKDINGFTFKFFHKKHRVRVILQ